MTSAKKGVKLFHLPFNLFGFITVSFPLFGLLICFLTSSYNQFDKINEIVCGVKNFIPSISAITGTAPQRYIWRVLIALHSAPRFLIACVHYNFYNSQIDKIPVEKCQKFLFIVKLNFVINIIENFSLIGVSYIPSIDNYPLHEKIFIIFMVTSCVYMAMTIYLYRLSHGNQSNWSMLEHVSYRFKINFFILILICTSGLIYFIVIHRIYCTPNAFSWFSACEYGIGMSNMGFHLSASLDFKDYSFHFSPDILEENHRDKDGIREKNKIF